MFPNLQKCRAEGLRERIVGFFSAEEADGLDDGRYLLLPQLRPRLILVLGLLALLLHGNEKPIVVHQLNLPILKVLLGLGVFLVRFGQLDLLLLNAALRRRDLIHLCCLQRVVGLVTFSLLLLCLGEVCLERLFHLLENAEDLAGLGLVRLPEGGRARRVRRLLQSKDEAFLARRDGALQQRPVPLHLGLRHHEGLLDDPGLVEERGA
mmetsp:Transcript_43930/g.121560  ORF Transcript_43930/g.121560 Transcript_43930/m.121560 type:complete len:208 (+) Transcript_43930:1085-1708(+)